MQEYITIYEINADFAQWGLSRDDFFGIEPDEIAENPFPHNDNNFDPNKYSEDPAWNLDDEDIAQDIRKRFLEGKTHEKRAPATRERGIHLTEEQIAKMGLEKQANEQVTKWVRILEDELGLGDPLSPRFRGPQKRPFTPAEERRTMKALQLLSPEIFGDDLEDDAWMAEDVNDVVANLTGMMRAQLDAWREARLFQRGIYGGSHGIVPIPVLGGFVEEQKIWDGWNLWLKEIMKLLKEKLQGLQDWKFGKEEKF